jgi:hypothetical protein
VRTVTADTTAAWKDAFKGGATRPMVRATIEKLQVGLVPYDLTKIRERVVGSTVISHPRDESGVFASAQFAWSSQPVELPNVTKVSWSRSVDSDVASMTMELINSEPLPLGTVPTDLSEFDELGHYTPSRGATTASQNLWGQVRNGWRDWLVPDRVIRTYEGYGFNAAVAPGKDPHLYSSGVWLIDEVEFTDRGMIRVTARDLARMLMEQIAFPPVVPFEAYPLSMSWYRREALPPGVVSSGGWFRPRYSYDSTRYYANAGYKGCAGGAYLGRHGRLAFDGTTRSYWMTLNNAITHGHGWVQGEFSARTVSAVKVTPWNGPYTCFISVMVGGRWQGRPLIPARSGDLYINGGIPAVAHGQIRKNTATIIKLRKPIHNVTKVRVSLIHNGTYGGDGQHVGVRDVVVSSAVSTTIPGGTHIVGDIGDWSDVARWIFAWGGWFWTRTASPALNHHYESDGTYSTIAPSTDNPLFPQGQIWGDIEAAGTGGKTDLAVDFFDKKPLLDILTQVREILNYIFFVDEFGGVVWRSPNIWQVGNWLSGVDGGPNTGRTSSIVDITDDETLMNATVKMSSRSVRERTIIASSTGSFAGVAAGIFNTSTGPFETGLRRIGLWSDQNFADAEECQIMADLVSVRQMFEWRTVNLTIPGYPRIQVDDQIRVYERTTAETYLHYVRSINSSIDLTSGKWTYTLGTHWLGEEPFQEWVFDPNKLSAETKEYLRAIGKM